MNARTPWRLKRTAQCKACPWLRSTDPAADIPNGYDAEKHRALEKTIARPGDLSGLSGDTPLCAMACHETHDAHCVGWLVNQLGPGNNIPLRMQMMTCANGRGLRLRGDQHATFADTLPGAREARRAA